jgi:hypothetical protein
VEHKRLKRRKATKNMRTRAVQRAQGTQVGGPFGSALGYYLNEDGTLRSYPLSQYDFKPTKRPFGQPRLYLPWTEKKRKDGWV